MLKKHKNPGGGLTAAGRKFFKKKEGSNLKPGVKGAANTPQKMRRKGSFLSRFYGRSDLPPFKKPNGEPTRFALAARAWGESAPTNAQAARRLASKGKNLLERYKNAKT